MTMPDPSSVPVEAETVEACLAEEWHRDGRGFYAVRRCTGKPKHGNKHTFGRWSYYAKPPHLIRAEAAELTLASERQRAEQAERERGRLRNALAGIVGASDPAELEQMEAAVRMMSAPADDKARSIDAIHALLATVTK